MSASPSARHGRSASSATARRRVLRAGSAWLKPASASAPTAPSPRASPPRQVEATPAAATKPKCCSQRTVTIPAEALAKTRQQHYWGSPAWIASYARRTHVEGYFGNLKNRDSGNVRRGWTRVVGLVKTSIMTACAIAATNIRLLRACDITDPLCAPDPEDHGFEELTPDVTSSGTGNTSPPTAA